MEGLTLASGETRRAWKEARGTSADPAVSPLYGGLDLAPQLGLSPLGPDPDSGLWEFAHLESGVVPERDAKGRLVLDEASAIVLVLIPGGEFLMGAQSEDRGLPNYSAEAFANEGPPYEVELDPFFLSKFEMTQGQYACAAGENPSTVRPGESEVEITGLHPV